MKTREGRIVASAPGKLMISGEYAVLEGARAMVAAVSRRAYVTLNMSEGASDGSEACSNLSPDNTTFPPEVLLTREKAELSYGKLGHEAMHMNLSLDVHTLREGDKKLGLGSSAAASVATAAVVAIAKGRDVDKERYEIMALALEGHRAVAPEGSGADVIASALGGFVALARDEEGIDIDPLTGGLNFVWRVVWTGHPARTSDFVRAVKSLAERDREAYDAALEPIDVASQRLIDAFEENDIDTSIQAVREHHRAMRSLGEAAGVPIVTAELDLAATLAEEEQGAAKPSGAGGGDVAIALFPDEARALAFESKCRAQGLLPVAMTLGAEGVRFEAPALLS